MNKCEKCGFLHYRTDPCRKPKVRIGTEASDNALTTPKSSVSAEPPSDVKVHTQSTAARVNARVMVDCVCETCGAKFEAVPHEVKRGKARTCSKPCAAKLATRPDQSGENNPNWKGGVPKTEKNKRYVERYPEKHEAHRLMTSAIRRGDLIRKPCEVCGEPKVDGHHDDYSRPLEVRWLCRVHHIEAHKGRFGTAGTQALPVDTDSADAENKPHLTAGPSAPDTGVAVNHTASGCPAEANGAAKFDRKAWMREYQRNYMRNVYRPKLKASKSNANTPERNDE